MQLHINGEERTLEGRPTVIDLLRELVIRPDQVAVEVNLHIVERDDFEGYQLQEGDRIEIMSFMGGG